MAEAATTRSREPGEVLAGERRHLTILFCDLVGSVTLAAQVDPEEWRATVAGYQRAASEAIRRFGGEVARYVGDGIMAFFGYPLAHDNDAERAVRAGLAILDAITQLNEQLAHPKLAVRIGIDSGRVVVGAGTGNAVDAFGDAANIAARVQAAAEPGSMMISEATQRLVAGLFVVEDRGAHPLKGIERLVQLFRVVRPSGMRGRFQAVSAAGGLTLFVGREDELRSLMSRWERVLEGEGQVVTLIGEAGIGKSRLVQRFHEEIAGTPHTWIEAGAGAFFQNTPFYPISEMLRQMIGDTSASDSLKQLGSRLTAVGLKAAEAIPLLAPLLNLVIPPEYPALALSPEQQRRRLLATLVEWVLGSARSQPLVSVIEDLHWVDPSTLELMHLLVEQGATTPLLLLYTARPEFRPPWPLRAHHTQITLNRLNSRHVRTMVGEVAAQEALSDETIAAVVERTGGVPLFVEELTRAVLESGNAKFTGREIPATLHDSLMARLDRLGPAKEVIQIGSVIGSDFSYELLHAAYPIAEADLQRALRSLTDAELLYVRGIAPEATYQFKHALIRDAAYEALLKSRRKELHRIVAGTIDEQFQTLREARPEILAQHWAEAGEDQKAIKYFQLAGEQAMRRSANREATVQFQAAIRNLQGLPQSPERDQRELDLLIQLGPALMSLKGFGAAECEEIYQRARDLCLKIGETPQLYTVLWGQWMSRSSQARWDEALVLARQLIAIATNINDPVLLLEAHHASWNTSMQRGDFAQADFHVRQGLALYSFDRHQMLASYYGGHDPGVCCYGHAGMNLWLLGTPDQASAMIYQGLGLAQKLGHRHSTARILGAAALVHQFRGDMQATGEQAAQILQIADQEGLPYWQIHAKALLGWALARQGRHEDGIALIRQSLSDYPDVRGSFRGYFLLSLADTLALVERCDEGLELLAEAEALLSNGERWHEAELCRVKAELMLRRSAPNEKYAMRKLMMAITVSQRQGTKSFELRAATSLARLLAKQDRRGEASAMLAKIYGWFTEGFDTADLIDARALLNDLSN
jgi:class 3 adenylate cyclase/predicted ATPase